MKKAKKQEIGLKLLRYRIRKEGIHLSKNKKRELGNIAKETEIPLEDLQEFFKEILQEEFSEIFE